MKNAEFVFKQLQKLTINKAFFNRPNCHTDLTFEKFMEDEPINLEKLNGEELTYLWRICKFELNK